MAIWPWAEIQVYLPSKECIVNECLPDKMKVVQAARKLKKVKANAFIHDDACHFETHVQRHTFVKKKLAPNDHNSTCTCSCVFYIDLNLFGKFWIKLCWWQQFSRGGGQKKLQKKHKTTTNRHNLAHNKSPSFNTVYPQGCLHDSLRCSFFFGLFIQLFCTDTFLVFAFHSSSWSLE